MFSVLFHQSWSRLPLGLPAKRFRGHLSDQKPLSAHQL